MILASSQTPPKYHHTLLFLRAIRASQKQRTPNIHILMHCRSLACTSGIDKTWLQQGKCSDNTIYAGMTCSMCG